ncbi:hypothetical protein BH20ACT15_BH20ACT15_12890 [soil metagenome]
MTAKRGRFLVAEAMFTPVGKGERDAERITLAGGRKVGAGRIVLLDVAGGRGQVVEELGRPDRAADVLKGFLRENGMGTGFPKGIEDEAARAARDADAADEKRTDLTGLPTFTVDPASARDFDDAVSAEAIDGGIRLWVHIADVAAHVRPGSALEAEAYRRATSTYVPGSVEPMLPLELSASACSLAPGVERLAVTAEIEVTDKADVRSARFYRSRIRSDVRLDYDQLDRIFGGEAAPDPVAEPLGLARRVAGELARRRAGSALEVHGSEPEFEFDADGAVVAAKTVPQTESHSLIEQLMVLTNEQVAELLERKRVPTLYRVHEQPDPERIAWMLDQLAALDIPAPAAPKHISPSQAGKIAVEASRTVAKEAAKRGNGADAYTSLVLRSLKQAHYTDRNLGHAGLGSTAYAHFTSPIRRYPDLIAHRALLSTVGAGEEAPRAEDLVEAGSHCSEREREAGKLEHRADDICAAFLLKRELFERGSDASFEGEVNGVIGAGAFVSFGGALADVYEGFLPARVIGGRERYELDETETMLVGMRGGDAIRIGDPVKITVERVDAPRGRIDLAQA